MNRDSDRIPSRRPGLVLLPAGLGLAAALVLLAPGRGSLALTAAVNPSRLQPAVSAPGGVQPTGDPEAAVIAASPTALRLRLGTFDQPLVVSWSVDPAAGASISATTAVRVPAGAATFDITSLTPRTAYTITVIVLGRDGIAGRTTLHATTT